MNVYEAKERARISAWQEDAKFFMNEFVNEEIDAHHPGLSKDDVAPLGNWAATYHEKADIASQGALAAVSYVASKGIKRLREQASQGAAAASHARRDHEGQRGAHGAEHQAPEGLRRGDDPVRRAPEGPRDAAGRAGQGRPHEREVQLFQAHLARAGAGRAARGDRGAATPSLEVVKAEASKAASGASGNPIQQRTCCVAAREQPGQPAHDPSGTNHAHVGASSGEADIGSILRGLRNVRTRLPSTHAPSSLARVAYAPPHAVAADRQRQHRHPH